MESTVKLVENWGAEKGIISPENIPVQFDKCEEEIRELKAELNGMAMADFWGDAGEITSRHYDAKMELGDCLVTLIILARDLGTSAEECLKMAYMKIKDRTGKVVGGSFIKSEDLLHEAD